MSAKATAASAKLDKITPKSEPLKSKTQNAKNKYPKEFGIIVFRLGLKISPSSKPNHFRDFFTFSSIIFFMVSPLPIFTPSICASKPEEKVAVETCRSQ